MPFKPIAIVPINPTITVIDTIKANGINGMPITMADRANAPKLGYSCNSVFFSIVKMSFLYLL